MPQMSPMWWEILFILFFTLYLMLNTIMYFSTIKYSTSKKKISYNMNINKWNW
uniref:ATP synthase F0 subunit 8 n=1 Tax=Dolycoris baccarum TaxID=387771 RepID=M1JUG3_DOLBA|nr:ATP synthase F0 subunit 8 [Dolycoris baccarum]AFI54815.1 ATP synthase F0 subunit 8 [Dolycoris baccarum]AGF25243.1 ATP synthase F0 subunit 8 [Dolycoris baccarum]AIC83235.1 ATP synthase F0 subunit 8 [Dolycoris baccarum]